MSPTVVPGPCHRRGTVLGVGVFVAAVVLIAATVVKRWGQPCRVEPVNPRTRWWVWVIRG